MLMNLVGIDTVDRFVDPSYRFVDNDKECDATRHRVILSQPVHHSAFEGAGHPPKPVVSMKDFSTGRPDGR